MVEPHHGMVKRPLPEQANTALEDPRLTAFRDYLEAIDRRDGVLPAQRRMRGLGFSVCVIDPRAMQDHPATSIVRPTSGAPTQR